jgi:hypothetical protein
MPLLLKGGRHQGHRDRYLEYLQSVNGVLGQTSVYEMFRKEPKITIGVAGEGEEGVRATGNVTVYV